MKRLISCLLSLMMAITVFADIPFVFAEADETAAPEVVAEEPEEVAEEAPQEEQEAPKKSLDASDLPALTMDAKPEIDPKTKEGQHPYANATSGKLSIVFKPVWGDQAAIDALTADGWTVTYKLTDQNGTELTNVAAAGTKYKVKKGVQYIITATLVKGEETKTASTEPKEYTFLDVPETIKVSCSKKENDVHIDWSKVKGAAGYYVYRMSSTKKPKKPIKFLETETEYVDKNLPGKKTYRYYVSVYYREGSKEDPEYRTCSDLSAAKKVTVYKYLTCNIRPIGWKTTMNRTTTLYKGSTGGSSKGSVKKGTKVEVLAKYPAKIPQQARPYRIQVKYKKNGKTKKGWVTYGAARGGVSGVVAYKKKKALDWTESKKEDFVNNKGYSSPTNYLIWTSTYTQRVNVFKGSKGHWRLVRCKRCTSGNFLHLTKIGSSFKIWKRMKTRTRTFVGGTGTYWYKSVSFFSKGNAIHGVCYRSGSNAQINSVRPTCQPATKGCLRMADENATWIYNNVPMNTTVVIR